MSATRRRSPWRWIAFAAVILLFAALVLQNPRNITQRLLPETSNTVEGSGYEAINPKEFLVSIFSEGLNAPTRIKLTPDGKFLFVSQLTGEVFVYHNHDGQWSEDDAQKLLTINTGFEGFPPEEGGLAGIVFSSDYINNHRVFFLYSALTEEGTVRNRVSTSVLTEKEDGLSAAEPTMIYEANFDGAPSHQITDGLGMMVAGKPHILLLIGEGFKSSRANDVAVDGGKVILIQEDGTSPLGDRPYPANPRVQALGLRNAFVITPNPFDVGKMFIADTGPDKYDRLIYTRLVRPDGKAQKPINLGWNGSQENLSEAIPDPNFPRVSDMVLHRLEETRTITGVAFHPGRGVIPASDKKTQSVLITLFGKTGDRGNDVGKQILLGRLTNLTGQPEFIMEPIIRRTKTAEGKMGNPIGLEIDPRTGDFFFADIFEGRIYQVKILEGQP